MPADPPADVVSRLRAAGCVFAEDEAALLTDAAATPTDLERLVELRVAGLPLEYLLGWVEFAGRRFAIEPGVFVPRRRTELLARCALRNLPRKTEATVVDLCCGCGAIGATVALETTDVHVFAADIDPVAVRCARSNLLPVGGLVFEGNLYDALPISLRGNVDLIVANAPYVPTDHIPLMPPEARDHEPRTALDGGPDGLDIVRRVITEAPDWLSPSGKVVVEISPSQAPGLTSVLKSLGGTADLVTDDDIGGAVLIVHFSAI